MKKIFIMPLLLLIVIGLSGCVYDQFYEQVSPTKYPATDKILIFEYADVNLNDVYNILFSDFLIIGKSSFNGPYVKPSDGASFGKSIGADVLITSSQFSERRTSFHTYVTPTTETTSINIYTGSGPLYGTATTYGTKTTTVPVTVNRYDQEGFFLKNINNIEPLWERTRQQYNKTEDNPIEGIWFNENYVLEIFQSGNQLVAFINEDPGKVKGWSVGDLKMIFGTGNPQVGVYLMGNRTPMLAEMSINKFGFLEIKLLNGDVLSFQKKN